MGDVAVFSILGVQSVDLGKASITEYAWSTVKVKVDDAGKTGEGQNRVLNGPLLLTQPCPFGYSGRGASAFDRRGINLIGEVQIS